MDLFQKALTDTGSDWGTYLHDSDNESERYSSEDEIGEIEEALLQKIHYAEDCGEDLGSAPTGGTRDTILHYRGDQITVTSLEINLESTETEKKDVGNISVKVEGPTFIKVEKSDSPVTISDDYTNVESCKNRKAKLKNESCIYLVHGSDSESGESKYKAIGIKSSKLSGKKTGNSSDSVIEISSSSDGINDLSGVTYKKNFVRSAVDIVSINCREEDSDIGSASESDITFSEQISEDPEHSKPTVTKRQWRKSNEDSNIPAETSRKVKLKRTSVIDAELRTCLDELMKDSSSEDDFFDAMVIESHSEDEALDVNYDSTPTQGRGYDQNLPYERRQSRGRYYQEPEGWPRYKCYNCLEFGHMSKDCPKPRQRKMVTCVLCGTQGHNDRQCPDALCYICSQPGHQARDCPNKKLQYLTCSRCSMRGHIEWQCPDRWRQYHLTTEPGKIQREESRKENKQLLAVNGKVFCYNCSKEGHFGHECWEEPMDRRAPLISPYVVRYDHIPRRFWKVQLDSTEPPAYATGFNDLGPDAGLDSIAPSVSSKKERRKMRLKRRQAAAEEAEANQDNQDKEPSTSKKPAKKAKKRKLEETESIAVDSKDQVDKQVPKKCRKKTKVEFEANEKLKEELAALPRIDRDRRIKKNRKEALNREEILSDYEETEDYVRKGAYVLRKRNNAVREAIAMEMAQSLPQAKKLSKSEKRAWKKYRLTLTLQQRQQQKPHQWWQQWQQQQRQEQQQQPQQQPQRQQQRQREEQQVLFKFNFEQFPELEQKFFTQNEDNRQLPFHQDIYFDSTPAVNQIQGGGTKKNKQKPKKKSKGGGPNGARHKNLQGNKAQPNISMPPDPPFTKPLSKKQKKREHFKRITLQKARGSRGQRQAAGASFMSERGFKVEPRY